MSSGQQATLGQTLALAEAVLVVLEKRGHAAVMIGGFALAVHNYTRTTTDLDLGVTTSQINLTPLNEALAAQGFTTELRLPDAGDPLGGVIDVSDANGAEVQVINFYNPGGGFPKVIVDALREAKPPSAGSRIRVVPLPHLIALKLYAGSSSDLSDVRELLANNADADVAAIKSLCADYGLDTAPLDR